MIQKKLQYILCKVLKFQVKNRMGQQQQQYNNRMRKVGQPSYIKKVYRMYVSSMSYATPYQYHFHAHYAAEQHQFEVQSTAHVDRVYQFCAIDIIYDGKQHSVDKNINLEIFFDQMNISNVSFDIAKQKFVKQDSKSIFRRKFNDKKGHIDYKFLSAHTHIISQDEFKRAEDNRNRIFLKKKLNYKSLKTDNDRLEVQLIEKDRMIDNLSNRINDLLDKNLELNRRINVDIEKVKNPLNIKVNIMPLKKDDFNILTDIQKMNRKINICNMESDLEDTKKECAKLKEKIAYLEVENRKLDEKCMIMMNELRDQFQGDQPNKELQRKIMEVDTLYLLKKSISHFEKPSSLIFPQERIQTIIQESEEDHNGERFTEEPETRKSQKIDGFKNSFGDNRQNRREIDQFQTFYIQPSKYQSNSFAKQDSKRSLKRSKTINIDYRESLSEDKMKSSAQFRASLQSMAKNATVSKIRASVVFQNLKEAVSKDTVISKQEQKMLLIRIQAKEDQIEFLNNQLSKKQALIDKMLVKEKNLEKLNISLAEEKARILMNSALNSLGANADEEITAKIKQLSVYNTEVLREKQQLSEQLRDLKQQLNERGKKLTEFEGVGRKSLIMLSQIGREKEMMQSKFRGVIEGQKVKQQQMIEQKNSQYQRLKEQFIQSQSELKQCKQKLKLSEEEVAKLKQQMKKRDLRIQEIKADKINLQIAVSKQEGEKREYELLSKKYDEIERLQKGIKLFVLKMESEYYKRFKNPNEEKTRNQIKKLFRETYNKINQFQTEYFQVLLTSMKLIEEATQKYYEETYMFYQEMATTIEKKEQLWEKKAELAREREIKIDLLKEKEEKIRQKKKKKLILAEDQQALMFESIKKLENRLSELENCKIHLKETNKNEKYTVPIINVNTPQNSMHQSLISMMEMFKTQNPQKQTMPLKSSGLMKSSVKTDMKFKQSAIMKIEQKQQEEDEAEKAPFIKMSMLSPNNIPIKKSRSKNLQDSHSWRSDRSIDQHHDFSGNSKESVLDIRKQSTSKFNVDKDKYKQSLMVSIAKQNEFSKEKMMIREKEMETFRDLQEKIRKTEKEVYEERTEKERTIMKYRQRQSEMEKQFRTVNEEAEAKVVAATKDIEKFNTDLTEIKVDLQDKKQLISKMTQEIQQANHELLDTITQRNDLKMQNEELIRLIMDYEAAEKLMTQKVRQIQENYLKHQTETARIIEERSMQFMEIEKIRTVQIQKLKGVILQLEESISAEVGQNLSLKSKIEEYKDELSQTQQKLEYLTQQSKITVEKMESELTRDREIMEELQSEIEVLQNDIMQLSCNFEAQEKEVIRLNFVIEKYEKERHMYLGLENSLGQREKNVKKQFLKYEQLLSEKNEKIKQCEDNFIKLQQRLKMLQLQTESTKQRNQQLKTDIEKAKQLQFRRERQVIQLQKQKSIEEIKKEKLALQVQQLQKDKKKLQESFQELSQKMQQLKKSMNQPPPSPRNPRSLLSVTNIKASVNPFGTMSVKSGKQIDSFQSMRYSKQRRQLSPQVNLQKSKRKQQQRMRQDSSEFLSNNKSQNIMKVSKNIDPNTQSITIDSSKLNKNRPTELLQVKALKRNRLLNLPSIDVLAQTSGENSNLGIIEQHNDEMEDTFLKSHSPKSLRKKLADQLQQQDYYQIELHQPKQLQQSAVDIEMMQSLHSVNQLRPYEDGQAPGEQQQGQIYQSDEINDYDERIYQEFQNYQAVDFVNQIVRLRLIIQQLSKKLQQKSLEQQNLTDSPYSNGMQFTNKSQKSAFQRSSKDQIINSNQSKKVHRLESQRSAKSINFFDIQLKSLQEEVQGLKQNNIEFQKKISENELVIVEQDNQIKELNQKIEQKQNNIEQLMQEIKNVTQSNCQLQTQIQKLKALVRELKSKLDETLKQFAIRSQQLVSQSLRKDEKLLQLNLAIQEEIQACNSLRQKLDKLQNDKKILQASSIALQKKLKKSQKQYLKYEEQAQLQILKLKEENDQLRADYNQKANELLVMGEKYLQIQDQKKVIMGYLKQSDQTHQENEKHVRKIVAQYQNAKNEIDSVQEKRKKVLKETRTLQQQNIRLKQEIESLSKTSTMQIQKYFIKSSQQNQLIENLKQKLRQKESIVLQLKNEIGLYNEETQKLKAVNEELSEELLRAEKSLKDIMVSYEQEFKKINSSHSTSQKKIYENRNMIQAKEHQLQYKNKEIKALNAEIRSLKEQNSDMVSKLQKFRIGNAKKMRELENEMALKNDKISRLSNEVSILQTKVSEERSERQHKLESNKVLQLARLNEKLQSNLEQLQKQLEETRIQLERRPKIEQFNEIKYKAALLENSLKHHTQQTKSQLHKNTQIEKQNSQLLKKQLQKANSMILRQREKANRTIYQLKQVVEAFKQLEFQNSSIRKELEAQTRAHSTLKLQNRQLEKLVNYLQKQNDQLQKHPQSMQHSKRSFSKLLTDVTLF